MNLNEMSRQEIYDFVVEKLRLQGKASVDDVGRCRYRGPGGLKCAAGWLLADSEYREDYEGLRAASVRPFEALELSRRALISGLQNAHDSASKYWNFQEDLEDNLRYVTSVHSLEYTAPQP